MTTQINSERSAPASRGWLEQLGDAIADLLFPPRCVACHRLGAWLCSSCVEEIEVIRPPLCHRCGLPIGGQPSKRAAEPDPSRSQSSLLASHRCRESPSSLEGLNAYAFHSEPLRTAIHQFKYEDLRSLAVILGRLMGKSWAELSPADCDPDVIVPVPLHATRLRERGYNQAALLARELGIHLRRPVREDVLVRTKATAPQVDLNMQERQANVRGAFRAVNSDLAGKGVLLVDDVYTTGATLEAASSALREHDVAFVWAYTLARAKHGSARG